MTIEGGTFTVPSTDGKGSVLTGTVTQGSGAGKPYEAPVITCGSANGK
jgi:hypothetical protein